MEFHEKLQELRKNRGLTQEDLAEVLYVSRTAVSKWESGRGYPSIDSLKEISNYFSVSIDELLYIGESVDVNNRIANHERAGDWKKALSGSQTLCYSFAPVMNPNRERAEAALIYKHKPPMNDEYIFIDTTLPSFLSAFNNDA